MSNSALMESILKVKKTEMDFYTQVFVNRELDDRALGFIV